MRKSSLRFLLTVAAVALAALPGCSTNTQGDSASPVFLTGDVSGSPLGANVGVHTPVVFTTTVITSRLKNPAATSLQFLDTRLDQYIVEWSRVDGGTKASAKEIFPGNGIVPANGTLALSDQPYMTADNLTRAPLDQLFPFNGGIDKETGRSEIRQAGRVVWYGHTLSGQPVTSDVATFGLIFTFSSTAGRIEMKRAQ